MSFDRLCLGFLRNRHEMYEGFSESDSCEEQRRTEQEDRARVGRRPSEHDEGVPPVTQGQDRGGWGRREPQTAGQADRECPAAAVLEESCTGQKRPRSGLLLTLSHLWREFRQSVALVHMLHEFRHRGWRLSAP